MNLFLTKEALYQLSYVGNLTFNDLIENIFADLVGAGDETRTRDIQLGRLELYQLSYSRKQTSHYSDANLFSEKNIDVISLMKMYAMQMKLCSEISISFDFQNKISYMRHLMRLVVGGGFEPPKAFADRFTVCSLWPLGNPTIIISPGFYLMEPAKGLEPPTH